MELNEQENRKQLDIIEYFKKHTLCIIVILLCIISLYIILSFKYTLNSDNNHVYRLNRITGDVQLINGSRLIKIDKAQINNNVEPVLTENDTSGGVKTNIKLLWRNNQLYYRFTAYPFNATLKKAYNNNNLFTVQLEDRSNFVIVSFPVRIASMTRLLNEKGQVDCLEINGKLSLGYDDVKQITNWSTTWNF